MDANLISDAMASWHRLTGIKRVSSIEIATLERAQKSTQLITFPTNISTWQTMQFRRTQRTMVSLRTAIRCQSTTSSATSIRITATWTSPSCVTFSARSSVWSQTPTERFTPKLTQTEWRTVLSYSATTSWSTTHSACTWSKPTQTPVSRSHVHYSHVLYQK